MHALTELALTNAAAATVLAAGVTLLAFVCRRPALLHALWVLVLVRLLTPPIYHVAVLPAVVSAAAAEAPTTGTGEPAADLSAADDPPISAEPPPDALAGAPARVAPASTAGLERVSWQAVAVAVWAAGAGGLLLLTAWRVWSFGRLLRLGRAAPPELTARVRGLSAQLGLGRCPDVWLVPGPLAPFVWPVGGRARVVLPARLFESLDTSARDAVLTHELAHLIRRDHWIRWLELAAVTVFWWHPVAWFARQQLQRLEEECCDGWVVAALPGCVSAYARALVETVEFLADACPALPPVASGFGYVRSLKRRLRMILQRPTTYRLSWPACLAVTLVGLLVLTLTPQRVSADDPEEPAEPAAAPAPPQPPEPPAPPSADRRDLDRRMDALERKLERVIRALERRGGAGATSGSAEKDAEGVDKAAEKERQKAEEARARARQKMEEMRSQARQRAEEARRRAHEMAEKAREEQARAQERGKEIHREIEESIRQSINPERMRELERQIEESVRKTVNPDRMEALSRQIEEAVNKAVDPKRLESLSRQIEESVNRALRAEDRAGRSRRDVARAPGARRAPDSHASDLERRMDRLEQRLDRILDSLEKGERPSGKP